MPLLLVSLLGAGCGGERSGAGRSLSLEDALSQPCGVVGPEEVQAATGTSIERTQRGTNVFGEAACSYWAGRGGPVVILSFAPADEFGRHREEEIDGLRRGLPGLDLPEPVEVEGIGDEASFDGRVPTSLQVRSGELAMEIDVRFLPDGHEGALEGEALERRRDAAKEIARKALEQF